MAKANGHAKNHKRTSHTKAKIGLRLAILIHCTYLDRTAKGTRVERTKKNKPWWYVPYVCLLLVSPPLSLFYDFLYVV